VKHEAVSEELEKKDRLELGSDKPLVESTRLWSNVKRETRCRPTGSDDFGCGSVTGCTRAEPA
jgi:hypothetical protein